jgi:hypothetical protein
MSQRPIRAIILSFTFGTIFGMVIMAFAFGAYMAVVVYQASAIKAKMDAPLPRYGEFRAVPTATK